MATLRVKKGASPGATYAVLDTSQPTVIGRDTSAEACIDDARASRRNAGICRTHGSWMLQDLQSSNGTFLNAKKVRSSRLRQGDSVQVGATLLTFQATEVPGVPVPQAEVDGARLLGTLREMSGVFVLVGREDAMDREVRVDWLHPTRILSPGNREALRDALDAARQLQDPGLAPVIRGGVDPEGAGAFVILRGKPLPSLADELSEVLRLPMETRLQVFRQIVEAALERASSELLRSPIGMAHIEVERAGEEIPVVRLPAIDLAAFVAERTGDLPHLPEHIPYLPPECQEAPRADGTVPGAGTGAPPLARILYSVGAVGYHLLTGKPPAGEGDGEEVLENHRLLAPAPARLLAPDVPAQLSGVLDRMLEKDPRRRPSGREEVLAAIPFSVTSAPLQPPAPRPPKVSGGSGPGRTAASARAPAGRAPAREAPSRTAPSRRLAAPSGNAPPQAAARPAAQEPARSSLVYLPIWTVVWAVLFFAARYASRALFHMMDGG